MPDFIDLRQKVLSGEIRAKREAIYQERLGGWLMLQEPMTDKRAELIQSALKAGTKTMDLKILYPGVVVAMLRYPHPDARPDGDVKDYPMDHPHAGELIFQPTDRDAVATSLPGNITEDIGQKALKLLGLNVGALEQEKKDSTITPTPTSDTSSPVSSNENTSSNS